eukprot:scaffold249099_cov66-Cyclotella_meneghiniana.AAC.2
MVYVWVDSKISQHLNPSNFSLQSPEGLKLAWPVSAFHPKIERVWTDWGNSQHLSPSILRP